MTIELSGLKKKNQMRIGGLYWTLLVGQGFRPISMWIIGFMNCKESESGVIWIHIQVWVWGHYIYSLNFMSWMDGI